MKPLDAFQNVFKSFLCLKTFHQGNLIKNNGCLFETITSEYIRKILCFPPKLFETLKLNGYLVCLSRSIM